MVGPSVLLPLLEVRLKVPSFYLLCHVHWRRFLAMSCSLTSIICSRSLNCFTKQGYMVASFGNAVWMNDVFQNLNFFYIFLNHFKKQYNYHHKKRNASSDKNLWITWILNTINSNQLSLTVQLFMSNFEQQKFFVKSTRTKLRKLANLLFTNSLSSYIHRVRNQQQN